MHASLKFPVLSAHVRRPPEYNSLEENSPDSIVRYDQEGRIRYLNGNAIRALGLDGAEEVLGKRHGEAWPDGRYGNIEKACAEVFASGAPQCLEVVISPTEGGRTEYHQIHIVAELDDAEKPVGTLLFGRDITGIRETELRLHHIINSIPGVAYTFRLTADGQSSFLYVSDAIEEVFGLRPEQVMGKFAPLHDCWHPEDRPKLHAAVAESARTMNALRVEVRACVPGRPERWFDVRSTPERQPDGSVVWYGLMLDITERKRMEDAARLREQEFRSLAEHSPDVVVRYDRDLRRLYANPAWARVNGIPVSEALGKTPEERAVVVAPYVTDFQVKLRNVIATGVPSEIDLSGKDGEGREIWLAMRAVPEFSPDGKVMSILTVTRDVTELKALADALSKREREFRSLADSSPDSIIRYDLEGRIRYLNSKLERDLGRTLAELQGRQTCEAWPDGRYAEIEGAMWRAIKGGEAATLVLYAAINTPEPRYHQIRVVPERDAAGRIVGALAFGSDVTDIYDLQAAVMAREQEFRTLVEHFPDVIVRYDRDCRRTYINPTMAALAGPYAERLLGTTPSQFPGGEQLPGAERWVQLERALREAMAKREPANFQMTVPDGNGTALHILLRLVPEYGPDGQVCGAMSVGRNITELIEIREKLRGLSFYDPITGLANRALFHDRLNQALADARWHDTLLGVLLIDLDRFKVVNDTLGHAMGDALLVEAGARLTNSVRDYDTVARMGGDEFAVLLPELRDTKDLATVANKILAEFAKPFQLDDGEVFIGTSIGIAAYPDDGDDAGGLVKFADLAMYAAKKAGGHGFRYYSADLATHAHERMKLETELRHALERQEFELHFQPKVALEDGRLIGSEALLRWNSSRFGKVMPDRFIGIAEDTGLIVSIGAWVLREACRTAFAWNAAGGPLHKVAVNLSPRQFADGGLVADLGRALDETGCRPEWIELEITESLLLDSTDGVLKTLEGFVDMGCTVAIDDFGTGYSALSYLTTFPIDTLKIDRSFIKDALAKPDKAELVKAIIAMARCLKIGVVAEGIETEDQATFLADHGCAIGQGYLYGKPMPEHELARGVPGWNGRQPSCPQAHPAYLPSGT